MGLSTEVVGPGKFKSAFFFSLSLIENGLPVLLLKCCGHVVNGFLFKREQTPDSTCW